jgi:hypothetical protein
MTEAEIRELVREQIEGFTSPRARAVVSTWTLTPLDIGDGWELFRINDDLAIAYSLNEGWADSPWGLADGLAAGNPQVRCYCPSLEEAVLEFLGESGSASAAQNPSTREAMMERARQKRARKKRD